MPGFLPFVFEVRVVSALIARTFFVAEEVFGEALAVHKKTLRFGAFATDF